MSDSVENIRKMPECSKSACLLLSIDHTACPLTRTSTDRPSLSNIFMLFSLFLIIISFSFINRIFLLGTLVHTAQKKAINIHVSSKLDDAILVVPSALHPLGPKDPGYERLRCWF